MDEELQAIAERMVSGRDPSREQIAMGVSEDDWAEWVTELYAIAANSAEPSRSALTIGTGGTIVDQAYAQPRARALFCVALYRLVPNLTDDLLTDKGMSLLHAWASAKQAWRQATDVMRDLDSDQLVEHVTHPEFSGIRDAFEHAQQRLSAFIYAWQRRHYLVDDWVAEAARHTMMAADTYRNSGEAYSGMLMVLSDLPSVTPGSDDVAIRWKTRPFLSPREFVEREAFVSGLTDFDSRTETVDAAVERQKAALDHWLRPVLQRRADEERKLNNALKRDPFRKMTVFEWLVRFQVVGDSRAKIARSLAGARKSREPDWTGDMKNYHSEVGKQIRRLADFIGLTLRDS